MLDLFILLFLFGFFMLIVGSTITKLIITILFVLALIGVCSSLFQH